MASMLVMVQREVGERLAAGPGDKAYGAVSVKVAYHATARVVGRVPASVFVPRPAVESVLVRIVRRRRSPSIPASSRAERLFELVRAGFAHRRKMLRRSLAGVVDPEAFAAAGIDPEARAEDLSVEDWGRLAACATERPVRDRRGPRPGPAARRGRRRPSSRCRCAVTGRRDDGYHLLDAEMVSIDLADSLTFEPGDGISVVDEVPGGHGARAVPDRARQPRGPGPRPGGTARRGPAGEAHPGRRRARRGLGRRRRRAALGRVGPTSPWPFASVPTCPSVSAGGGPGSPASGRASSRLPSRPGGSCCCSLRCP